MESLRKELQIREEKTVTRTSETTREYEIKIKQTFEENNKLIRKISEYEFQMTTLSEEIQRLNSILKSKIDENSEW